MEQLLRNLFKKEMWEQMLGSGPVLTFDGNGKLPQKVTYNKIKKHLEVYNCHFSYGSVFELCGQQPKTPLCYAV